MRMHSAFSLSTLFTAGLSLAQPAAAVPPATTVSPGSLTTSVGAPSACPTFSWSAVTGAAGFELVVLDLSASEESRVVLAPRIAGAALSWTPDAGECLAPGRLYAWTVRALDSTGAPLDSSGDAQGWAPPRRFTVPSLPTASEVAAALATLRRWQEGQMGSSITSRGEGPSNDASPIERAVELAASSAVRGENPATSGINHGLWGQTGSAAGAGVVAANLAGGADLRLDGGSAGVTDTILTEKSLDRRSPNGESFSIENSGGGDMKLFVQGVLVSLTGHPHSGGDITAGTVADARIATTLTRDSEVMPLVLAADGQGSGLNADLLDNLHASAYQVRVSGACASGQAIQLVNSDGSVVCASTGGPPVVSVVDDPTTNLVGSSPSIAIGADGLPAISYQDGTARSLKLAKCNDPACTGGDEAIVTLDDPANEVGNPNDLAIGADGNPVIAYHDATLRDVKVVKCNDPACSGSGETITVVAGAHAAGSWLSIAVGLDGNPVIAFFDDTDHGLHVVKCNDPACVGGDETDTAVDTTASYVGFFASIAVPADGLPVVAYFDDTNNHLKVAKCNDATCAGHNETISEVDGPGMDFYYVSIAVGSDGLPVISYKSEYQGTVRVCKCNDAACSGGDESIVVLDGPTPPVGAPTAIAIGADNLPVIAYQDQQLDALKVAKCLDSICSPPPVAHLTIVDHPAEAVASGIDIAVGTDGYPVIAYHDSTAGRLKVAKCFTRSCFAP